MNPKNPRSDNNLFMLSHLDTILDVLQREDGADTTYESSPSRSSIKQAIILPTLGSGIGVGLP